MREYTHTHLERERHTYMHMRVWACEVSVCLCVSMHLLGLRVTRLHSLALSYSTNINGLTLSVDT
jgi:hypothetical protein